MKKILILICFVLAATSINAQSSSAKKEINVDGVCKSCKIRIEKESLKVEGVKYANWDIASHNLTVIIDENTTNVETVQKAIARIGHDNGSVETQKQFLAPEKAYNKLPACCKYRDEEVVRNHE